MHDYRFLGAIGSDAFTTIFLLGIFFAAWWKDKRRFSGCWLIGWSLYTLRFVFELAGIFFPKASLIDFFLLAVAAASSIFFLSAARVLRHDDPYLRKAALASAAAATAIAAALMVGAPQNTVNLVSFAVFGALQIFTGALFIEFWTSSRSVGALLAGLAQIVWGLFKLSYPFSPYPVWLTVWGYEYRGFFQVATGSSVAIMLFELARDTARRETMRYRVLFEGMTDAAFVADFQGGTVGKILEANGAAAELLGYGKEELQRLSPLDLSRSDSRSESEKLLRTLAQTGKARFFTHHLAKDGRRIPVEINASVFLLDGKPVVLGIARDRREMEADEAKLRAALEQRELLLREMNHRVKNNLQIVSSLLRLQSNELHESEAVAALQDSQARVASMALVHEILYSDKDIEAVDMSGYLPRLFRDIAALRDPSDRIRREIDIESIKFPIDRAIPIGLIVTELLTNAYKHAFAEAKGGLLRLSLVHGESKDRLVVADDGAGTASAPDPSGTHLGMVMIEALVAQIGAAMTRQTGRGTTWVVDIPPALANRL
jgi:PAS domain S-box-containing protein